jgi:hypothetical protein
MVRIRILGSGVGADKIELNGSDITHSVTAFEIKASASQLTEIKLTLIAEVDVEVEASLLALEKAEHVRFSTLSNPRGAFIRSR